MEENNKIIAEFMGYKIENKKYQSLHFHSSNESDWVWEEGEIVTLNGSEVSDESQEPYFSLEDLPFNSDWNWLMEVVEKIEKEFCSTNIHYYSQKQIYSVDFSGFNIKYEESEYGDDKLRILYEAVVKFINFYNKQKEE